MRRRAFIAALGSAAAWPVAGQTQQAAPSIGYLSGISAGDRPHLAQAFRQGLNESGHTEGRDVTIEYRFADNQMDRLPALAADLINRKVAVIVAVGGNNAPLTVKRLTSTIPILFTSGVDPIKAGLVASLNRPEANVTGVSWFTAELGPKHIELLQEFVAGDAPIALLTDPNNQESGDSAQSVQGGAGALGRRLLVLKAGSVREIDAAFALAAEQRAGGLVIGAGPFFSTRARQLAVLAARFGLPMIGASRDVAEAGGLITYGNNVTDAYRRIGAYAGRILKGVKPADLPIDRAVRFELVINLGTARALGLKVPDSLVARADEVIE